MDLNQELAELQNSLATTDFNNALSIVCDRDDGRGVRPLLVKVLKQIRIKIDGSKNHSRPHLHIDYGHAYHAASYAIDNGERLVGKSTYDNEVCEWIAKHRPKLQQVWTLVQAGQDARSFVNELRVADEPPSRVMR
jgi:hypothetical protein